MSKFFPKSKHLAALRLRLILAAAVALGSGFARADIYRSLDPDTPTKFTNTLPNEGRWELFLKEAPAPAREEPASDERRFLVDSGSRYASHIEAAAMATKVDAALIRAVISVESGYNPSAVSRAGAVGLMQLMPGTAKRYKVTNRRDPGQNIHGGARYLSDLLRLFKHDLQLALAAYNAGEMAVIKFGNRIPPYRETLAYVPKVMKFYKRYSAGAVSAAESGYQYASEASSKKAAPIRISRTFLPNPA